MLVSPLPWPGEVARGTLAGPERVRVGPRESAVRRAPSSGLRPPSPALGRRDMLVSPLPWPGEVARGPLAGPERVRVGPPRVCGAAAPLIRPSATFSRVGRRDMLVSPRP